MNRRQSLMSLWSRDLSLDERLLVADLLNPPPSTHGVSQTSSEDLWRVAEVARRVARERLLTHAVSRAGAHSVRVEFARRTHLCWVEIDVARLADAARDADDFAAALRAALLRALDGLPDEPPCVA